MTKMPPVIIKVEPDSGKLINIARIIEKHIGALADDLEKLRDGEDAGQEYDAAEEIYEAAP